MPGSPCDLLRDSIGDLFACVQHGAYVRIRTPFLYPDGDVIDLYWKEIAGTGTGTLTDLGETLRWLKGQTTAMRLSARGRQLIGDVCLNHGVELYRGMLMARIAPGANVAQALTRLAQASIRVSDLWFTFRTRVVETATDEVEELLQAHGVPFARGESLLGRSGRSWNIDFHTRLPAQSSLVYVLSTGSRSAAPRLANHVVASWYDLSHLKAGPGPINFVSLFDDTMDVWRDEDFRLLAELSTTTRWSKPEEFLGAIRGAA